MRQRLVTLFGVLVVALLAQDVSACSGPGRVESSLRNQAIGLAILASMLAAGALMFPLRHLRLGARATTYWPLLILFAHPAVFLFSSTDCGMTARQGSTYVGALWSLMLLVEFLLLCFLRRPRHRLPLWAWAISIGLAAVSGLVWAAPWTLDPLPNQRMNARYLSISSVVEAQNEFRKQHGRYAEDFSQLQSKDNLRGFAVQPDKRVAHASPGTLEFEMRLLLGNDSFALIVRTVNWPENGVWTQYLWLANGTVFEKSDPGHDKFLEEAPPINPAEDGWTKIDPP